MGLPGGVGKLVESATHIETRSLRPICGTLVGMRICIFGVGGVGGYIGGRLAAAGNSVAFVARGVTLDALRKDGLRVESPLGDIFLPDVEATNDPAEVGEVDAVVLGVKAWQVPEVATAALPMIGESTAILPLQNGVEAADQVAAVHGVEHTLGGMCRIVAFVIEPARIRHQEVEPFVALGELDNRRSERVERLTAAFSKAGVDAVVSPDIQSSIWQKMLFIAPVSGVGAVARVPIGELRSRPETYDLLREAMLEVKAVATARGVALADDAIDKTLRFVDGLPENVTSSMQRDIMDGRPSELEALNGAVVRLGREAGVPTPVHAFIHAALAPVEARARRAAADTD
jgi:2-dehydropantoate 2-reductase